MWISFVVPTTRSLQLSVHTDASMKTPSGCRQSLEYSPPCPRTWACWSPCACWTSLARVGHPPSDLPHRVHHYHAGVASAGFQQHGSAPAQSALLPCKPRCGIQVMWQVMRTSQRLGVLRLSQAPPGPPPAAQPRVADRSHSHTMPAPAHLHCLSTQLRSSSRERVPGRSDSLVGECLTMVQDLAEQNHPARPYGAQDAEASWRL